MPQKKDIILAAIIILIATGMLAFRHFSATAASHAEITVNNTPVTLVGLNVDEIFYIESIPNILFEVSNGQIAFIKSDCPDQICVDTGFLSRSGQMAACLPNGTVMRILGGAGDIDVFIR